MGFGLGLAWNAKVSLPHFFFLCITLKPRVERYKSLRALNTSPPQNRFTFL